MKKLKVAFVLCDPIGKDSDGNTITIESSKTEIDNARLRCHLHALNTQPKYKKWMLKHLSKRQAKAHLKAAKMLAKFISDRT
jgi:hypothetical protein